MAAVGVALGALVAVSPVLLGALAAHRLSAAIGVPVSLGTLRWDPLTGTWIATNFRLGSDRKGPPVVVRTVRVQTLLRDVLKGEYRVRDLVLDQPRLRLRLVAGGWEPVGWPAGAASNGSATPPPILIDHVGVRRGVLSLGPLPGGDTVFRIERADLDGAVEPGRVRAHFRAAARVEGGALAVRGGARTTTATHRVRLHVDANDVPLARVMQVTGTDGGRRLSGRFALHAGYDDAGHGGHRHRTLRGRASVAEASVGNDEPGLRVQNLSVSSFQLDAERHVLALGRVRATGADISLRWLPEGLRVAGVIEPGAAAEPDSGWQTTIAEVLVREATVRQLEGDEERLRGTIAEARVGSIGPGPGTAPFTFSVAVASGGELVGRGELTPTPLAVRGRLHVDGLVLPPLVDAARLPVRLESGRAGAVLDLVIGRDGLRVAGTVDVEDLKTISPDPGRPEHVLACRRLTLAVDEARLNPLRASVRRVELEWPYVLIDRTTEGVFPLSVVRTTDGGGPADEPVEVRMADLAITGGRIDFRDQTLTPAYWRSLANVTVEGVDVAFAPARVARLSLDGLVDELSPFHLEGTIGARTQLRAEARQLALPPFNPYLRGVSAYAISSGAAEVTSEIVLDRGELEATNHVVLSRLGVQNDGGKDFLQEQLGLPLTLAIALMKDYRGDIALALPLGGDLAAPTFSLRSTLLQAIVQAMRGAVLSPLNALGRIFLRDGRIEHFALDPIPFPPGRAKIDHAGEVRAGQVARVLQSHPELSLAIRGTVGAEDVGRLQDREALDALSTRPAADSLRTFLRARIAGAPLPSLDADDRARLDTLVRSLPWPAEHLTALATERADAARATLLVKHRVAADRMTTIPPEAPTPQTLSDSVGAVLDLRER